MMMKKIAGVLFTSALLAGCNTSKPIYYWGDYQSIVYQYYQQDDTSNVSAQVTELQELMERARSKGKLVPPGLHAHLGLLYADVGNTDQAFTQFNTEKSLFPESAPFMDFLMSKDKGSFK